MRDHYYQRLISRRVDPLSIYTAYRMAQIDHSYSKKLCELLLPYAAAVGGIAAEAGSLHNVEDRDAVISDLSMLLWQWIPNLLKKEFPAPLSLLSYLSRRMRPEAFSRLGISNAPVFYAGTDDDPWISEQRPTEHFADVEDRRRWTVDYVKRSIRFSGARRNLCISLVNEGREALRGIVPQEEEEFYIDYISVLSRMGHREYASI